MDISLLVFSLLLCRMPIAGARFDVGPKMGNKFVTNIWFFRFDFYVLGRVIK